MQPYSSLVAAETFGISFRHSVVAGIGIFRVYSGCILRFVRYFMRRTGSHCFDEGDRGERGLGPNYSNDDLNICFCSDDRASQIKGSWAHVKAKLGLKLRN